MFDSALRPWIDPPLNAIGRRLAATGVSANSVTLVGGLCGALAGASAAVGGYPLALVFIVLSRAADGLDGAVARANGKSDLGGYLDIVCDYVFYTAVPLGMGASNPDFALPAATLLAGFLLASSSFLGFAAIAEKRGMSTTAQGEKSIYYLAGLAEGAETIAVLAASAAFPAWFPVLAYGYAVLCALTVVGRVLSAWRLFG